MYTHDMNTGMKLNIELDDDLYAALETRAKNNEFDSTEEYCRTVLEIVIGELEQESTSDEVEDRLEDLGYLN